MITTEDKKKAQREYSRKYRETHREEAKATSRKWYKEHSTRAKITIRKWRENHREQIKGYRHKYYETHTDDVLRQKYGITSEEYNKLLKDQRGVCKICKCKKPLGIDHSHITGTIRGLLCKKCNIGLGQFEDNIEWLQNAINYIEQTKETFNGKTEDT